MKTLSYFTDDEIVALIKDKTYKSIRDILKKLNVSNIRSGSYYTRIRQISFKHKLDTSHWIGGHFSKGKNIGDRGRRWKVYPLNDYLSNKRKIHSCKLKHWLFNEGIKINKCEMCKLTSWNDKFIGLELHHIDGNRNNNSLKNIQILCPNCHSQTQNYGYKGYGNYGRNDI